MKLIDADAIRYDQLLMIGNKERPLEWAASQSSINSMPTIEAKPVKHGRWEMLKNGHDAVCTNCRLYWIPIEDKYDYWFCPRCGADMREEKE
jgi:hypothetical protein